MSIQDGNGTDQFVKLDLLECETVLEEVNPALKGSHFHPATVTILANEPSFYPGYRFLDLADYETVPNIRKFVLYKPGHVVILNWTNEPIYALNEKAPIHLNEATVTDYVRFFFTYVRGRHGRFIITESVDDVMWRDEPPPAARKAIGKMLEPLHIVERSSGGGFRIVARMMFKDSLFKTTVNVQPNGLVNLSDEELLIEDMPVLDDTFGQ
ncbi:MAG: hypothetical protein HYS17_01025 [Micavibrio aeruginosavorus]|uniref:Uncharacterized protein n=1 Tax=Micavibrio aeruginosavorus TaxID=349221 RepID=A0A7T5UGZ1_9BACT|nr:MAG: hypothetical protein HYS17_01025 [Micavibrio aeruginosavorus]